VPAGTPKAVVQKIQADTAKALASPEIQQRAREYGLKVVASTPEQFNGLIASEMKRWGKVVTDAKIQID
jgi:tripartite-type tricarboxylate transporter receptor subunit TctC